MEKGFFSFYPGFFFPSKQLINLWFGICYTIFGVWIWGDVLFYFYQKWRSYWAKEWARFFFLCIIFSSSNSRGGPEIEFTYNLFIIYHFIKVVSKIFKKLTWLRHWLQKLLLFSSIFFFFFLRNKYTKRGREYSSNTKTHHKFLRVYMFSPPTENMLDHN